MLPLQKDYSYDQKENLAKQKQENSNQHQVECMFITNY